MNVKYENRHFKFREKENTVFINFTTELYDSPAGELTQNVTYCTISVYGASGKIAHYHAGTVFNHHDVYNQRTGMFIAFRKALRQRWEAIHEDVFKSYDENEALWEMYHKALAHFLAAMMDGKVVEDAATNPL